MKFVIFTPRYSELSGGPIVLHKLCHILNKLGNDARIQIMGHWSPWSMSRVLRHSATWALERSPILRSFSITNSSFHTPLIGFNDLSQYDDAITIYPEVVSGNPFGSKRVVRWFLHKPGFHTNETNYGEGEYHIDFNEFLRGYDPGPNHLSALRLYVIHTPFEHYNRNGALSLEERSGVAYCLRKGELSSYVDLEGAICIDNKSHAEVSSILKRVRRFYSFDQYTAYSYFAALCGALSIVVPIPGVGRDKWYADETSRYGIAYGEGDVDWALSTQHLVEPMLRRREVASETAASQFVKDVAAYFSLPLPPSGS